MTGHEAMRRLAEMRQPPGTWRQRARLCILEVLADHGHLEGDELLAVVDAAYPFGERAMHPYKAWLAERKLLIELMTPAPTMPSADEAAACMVARDLVELGREDEARALLDAQAPNRLARRCLACGALPNRPCVALDSADLPDAPSPLRGVLVGHLLIDIPHEARLTGYIADPGPLFKLR